MKGKGELMRILLVEDERRFLKSLNKYLTDNGFAVDCAETGAEAIDLIWSNSYDLAIIDINLPDKNGFQLCEEIQGSVAEHLPIIMATARGDVTDRIRGLNSGADDYIIKPFHFEELRARIQSVLRRAKGKQKQDFVLGDIVIHPDTYIIEIAEEIVFFSVKEFEILYHLALHQPAPQKAEDLIEHVWNETANPFSNSVRVHIANIRKKLAMHSKHVTIKNIKTKGYYVCIQ